jgi:DUF1365 family protein
VKSCLYEGRVRHSRRTPIGHRFEYRVALAYLELDELDQVFAGRIFWSTRRAALAWFRRQDYMGPAAIPLDQAVRDLVQTRTGARPSGPIGVLTHLRTFGYVFNPVSFYYCWDEKHEKVETVVAEIENTPWRERHAYVVPGAGGRFSTGGRGAEPHEFKKEFHISPFMDMDLDYRWRFTEPRERALVHMENRRAGEHFFTASLALARREITGLTLARVLASYPLGSAKVMAAIYWNALRLWWKGAPFFPHPKYRTKAEVA